MLGSGHRLNSTMAEAASGPVFRSLGRFRTNLSISSELIYRFAGILYGPDHPLSIFYPIESPGLPMQDASRSLWAYGLQGLTTGT